MSCSHQKICYQLRNKNEDNTVKFLQFVSGRDLIDDVSIYSSIARKENCIGSYTGFQHLDYFDQNNNHIIKDVNFPFNQVRSKYRWMLVPCGQCVECRLQKAREMANRIYLEMLTSETDVWSVTLTYDDEFLPYGKEIVDGNGELRQYPTLVPKHVQEFNKLLRQFFQRRYDEEIKNGNLPAWNRDGIKFYCAGEYGDDHGRPHYHLIYFNIPLLGKDVRLCKHEKSQTGDDLFECDILTDLWKKGRVRLNAVSWQYACYVARYIMKKQTGQGVEVYNTLGIVPPFTRCSTKEGIGRKYFELHKDELLKNDCVLIKQGDKAVYVSLPHYFLRLAEKEGIDISKFKERRAERANDALNKCLFDISQDYFEYQRNLEQEKLSFQKRLPRVEF